MSGSDFIPDVVEMNTLLTRSKDGIKRRTRIQAILAIFFGLSAVVCAFTHYLDSYYTFRVVFTVIFMWTALNLAFSSGSSYQNILRG